MKKNQSAFSLIEVLVALLILSVSIVGASKMLVQTIAYYQQAELRERVTILAWSIASTLKAYPNGLGLEHNMQKWQTQLKETLPNSQLTIMLARTVENHDVYTMTIQSPTLEKIQIEIIR